MKPSQLHVTSEAERQALRDRYSGVASAAYVNSFLESLPRDMLFVLRTGDLVRGLNKALGGTSRERLQILGEAGTFSSD
jgi:aarF domain-containing kinase